MSLLDARIDTAELALDDLTGEPEQVLIIRSVLRDVRKALEAAQKETKKAWAMRVLDAWAERTRDKGYPDGWTCMPWHQGKEAYKCCLSGNGGRIFYGHTADAARLLAAETLVNEDQTLGVEQITKKRLDKDA